MAPGLPIGEPRHIGTYPPVRVNAHQWVDGTIVLLGDACHGMHPAQSQGMNISIRCADALAKALVESPDDPVQALATHEQSTQPVIDPVLEANHQAGSLFDTTAAEPLNQFTERLRQLGSDEHAALGYTMATAGYPTTRLTATARARSTAEPRSGRRRAATQR
jgi:2-polyprenyl-6-methoxyphenol hydroxylase-like FAD-dependent oxidoreductase